MSRYQEESVCVASIYPGQLEIINLPYGPNPDPKRGGRNTRFEMKPVKKGGRPFVKSISDVFQSIVDTTESQAVGKVVMGARQVDCHQIANSLVERWTAHIPGVPPGGAPGVIKIANTVCRPGELQQMREMQAIYFEWHFQEAERWHQQGKWKMITSEMKLAAVYLDRKTPWSDMSYSAGMVECPHCGEGIKSYVTVCRHCNRDVVPESIKHVSALEQAVHPDLGEDFEEENERVMAEA